MSTLVCHSVAGGGLCAGQLAALGHTVVIGARSAADGEKAADQVRASGGDASSVILDVTDPVSAAAAAQFVQDRFGQLDALVNKAGISHQPGAEFSGQLARSADVDHIRYVFENNVFAIIIVTSAFLPLLRRSAAPRIVNVTTPRGDPPHRLTPSRSTTTPLGAAVRVFRTGGWGWIGSAVIPQLTGAGHDVRALARSQASAAAVTAAGAAAVPGDLDDLRAAAKDSERVVYLGFNHAVSAATTPPG